jgi:hypothetical protein
MAKERTITETIREAEKADENKQAASQVPNPEDTSESTDMPKAPQWGGFKIETGIVPERATSAGKSKYDWASFPAPKDPNDSSTWPSVFIPGIGGKTIYSSIRKHREKMQAEKKPVPEFTVSVSKDPKGVRVIRKV